MVHVKMVHIIKRDGHLEKFDERKVLLSCFEACLNAQLPRKSCVRVSEEVTGKIKKLVKNKKEVKSDFIFRQSVRLLKNHSKEAAFMFETHRDVS